MATSLAELQAANFRTSKQADDINTDLMRKLALKSRYEPARLAIARSLAIPDPPSPIHEGDDDEGGKVIRGEHLFGTGGDLGAWVALLVEHTHPQEATKKEIQDLVRRHWHRGALLLAAEYAQCDDFDRFMMQLAERAGVREGGPEDYKFGIAGGAMGAPGEPVPITIRIGDIGVIQETGLPAEWVLNKEGQSPHLGIFGKPGKGKTFAAKGILQTLARHGVPVLLIDPKGEFRDDADFARSLGAATIVLGRDPIPLDALAVDAGVIRVADGLVDALAGAVPELGPKQKDSLREVAKRVLSGSLPAHMDAIVKGTDDRYKQNRQRPDVLTATLHKLQDYKLFEPQMGASEFFSRSWIISVAEVQDEALRFAMLFVLDALLRFLRACADAPVDRRLGVRALRTMLAIDEARRVVEVANPALLEGLVLECRSKGLSTFFISQSPDHLDRATDDIVRQFEVAATFEADLSPRAARRIFGPGTTPELVQSLQKGQCLARLPGRDGPVIVRAWQPVS